MDIAKIWGQIRSLDSKGESMIMEVLRAMHESTSSCEFGAEFARIFDTDIRLGCVVLCAKGRVDEPPPCSAMKLKTSFLIMQAMALIEYSCW